MSTLKKEKPKGKASKKLPGYPHYSKKEDIYKQAKEETELDPENTTKKKKPNVKPQFINEKNFEDDMTAGDLDIPRDIDFDEDIPGLEDEENDYYSLGGERHHNLDED